jgi:hypothetical protein
MKTYNKLNQQKGKTMNKKDKKPETATETTTEKKPYKLNGQTLCRYRVVDILSTTTFVLIPLELSSNKSAVLPVGRLPTPRVIFLPSFIG